MILVKFAFSFAFNLRKQNIADFSFIFLTQNFMMFLLNYHCQALYVLQVRNGWPIFQLILVQDEINIQWSSINQKANSTNSVMLCMGAIFVTKVSCLVARIVSFNIVGLDLLTFRVLEPYPSKDILTLMTLSWYLLSLVWVNASKLPCFPNLSCEL